MSASSLATRNRTRFREVRWTAEVMRHTGVQVGGSILLAAPGARPWRPARLLDLAAPAVRSPEADEGPIEMGLSPEPETMRRRRESDANGGPARPVEGGDVAGA